MRSVLAIAVAATLAFASGQPSDRSLVFRNVDVFDGSRIIRRTTVVVRDGMIRAVGSDTAVPASAQIVDGAGKTLLPGLFDAHMHLGITFGEQFLRDALNFGVTTEIEMWGSDASRALRKKIAAGEIVNTADLRTAGTGVTVPKGHPTQMGGPPFPTLAAGDDLQAFVDARIAEGADFIKISYDHGFPTLTRQQLEDVVAAAHRRNTLVVAHVLAQRDAREAIAAGVDGLVHIFADSAPEPGFAELAAQHHVFVVPTLSVLEAVTDSSATKWWQAVPQITSYITPSMQNTLNFKMPPGLGANRELAHAQAAVGALHRAGAPILAGTDAPAPGLAHGLSVHRELELLVLSGLTPVDALAAATSAPARAFGFHDRGRIAAGMRADLLLVNGDPTVEITATRDIAGVWTIGVRHARVPAGQ